MTALFHVTKKGQKLLSQGKAYFGHTTAKARNPSRNLKNKISIGLKVSNRILAEIKVVPHITIVIQVEICPVTTYFSRALPLNIRLYTAGDKPIKDVKELEK